MFMSWFFCFSLNEYSLTTSDSFVMMGVIPVSMHSASVDVVLYALAILKLISRCTLAYFCLLCPYFIASNHTGAPYVSSGRMAPLYIVAIASCLIPHCSLAARDRLYISFVHLSATYFMCS